MYDDVMSDDNHGGDRVDRLLIAVELVILYGFSTRKCHIIM